MTERPIHPTYGQALSGAPKEVDGYVFHPFRIGVNRYTRATADGRLEIREQSSLRPSSTGRQFILCVDGAWVQGRKFRKLETAARAGIAAVKS